MSPHDPAGPETGARQDSDTLVSCLDGLGAGVAVVDAAGFQIYVNKAFCDLVGFAPEELLGRSAPFAYWPPDESPDLDARFRLLRTDAASASGEVTFAHKDGRRVPVDMLIRPVSLPGGRSAWVASVRDITEKKAIRARLRKSESLYRAAFDVGSIGTAIADSSGVIQSANAAFSNMLGYPPGGLEGRAWHEITDPEHHESDRLAVSDMLAGRRDRYITEKRYIHASGDRIWAKVEVVTVAVGPVDSTHFVAKIVDISAQKRTEHSLQRAEDWFRQIVNVIPEVFWMARADLTETKFVSPAFEAIWGYSVEELYRDPNRFIETIHPEDRASFIATIETNQKHNRVRFSHEYRIVRPDGELRWIWDQGFPIVESDGSIDDFIGIALDITRRKKLELELMKAQAFESVGLMAGQLAHDFNNLLGVVAMNASYLKRRTDPGDPSNDAINAILDASRRGSGVIKALLSAARRQRLSPTVFDLVEAVHGSRGLFAAIGDRHPLHFETSVSRLMVKADRPALEQALLNLVLNSAEAMPAGGVITLRVRHASAEEAVANDLRAGAFAVVEVGDTGTGMAEDVMRRAAEPFFTTKGEIGTGLGIPAVSGFASQSGGKLVIQSKLGEGSCVSIFLPVHVASRLSAGHSRPRVKEPAGAVQRVLLVEDDHALRKIIASQLVDEGYVVLEAAEGELALRTMAEQRVDVVVSDIVLKGMSGWELRRRVQRLFGKPVILMTGYAIEEESGDPDVEILPKPFPLELLVSAIERNVAAA